MSHVLIAQQQKNGFSTSQLTAVSSQEHYVLINLFMVNLDTRHVDANSVSLSQGKSLPSE